jgi:hypothetical protein
MSIEIKEFTTQETAYDKFIKFTTDGQEYSVLLHWDKWDGYSLNFTELENTSKWISDPDWLEHWEDGDADGASLESHLDYLTRGDDNA